MSEDGVQDAQELTGGGGDVLGLFASIASRASAMYVAARDFLSLADSRASSHEEGNRSGAPNTPPAPRIIRRVSERHAVNVSRQSALYPTSIQRARAAAGYHGEEQNQEQSASTGTSSISAVVQYTGLASSDAARNNLADEMEEDSRSKKRRKMGTKPTCIREQHDARKMNLLSTTSIYSTLETPDPTNTLKISAPFLTILPALEECQRLTTVSNLLRYIGLSEKAINTLKPTEESNGFEARFQLSDDRHFHVVAVEFREKRELCIDNYMVSMIARIQIPIGPQIFYGFMTREIITLNYDVSDDTYFPI